MPAPVLAVGDPPSNINSKRVAGSGPGGGGELPSAGRSRSTRVWFPTVPRPGFEETGSLGATLNEAAAATTGTRKGRLGERVALPPHQHIVTRPWTRDYRSLSNPYQRATWTRLKPSPTRLGPPLPGVDRDLRLSGLRGGRVGASRGSRRHDRIPEWALLVPLFAGSAWACANAGRPVGRVGFGRDGSGAAVPVGRPSGSFLDSHSTRLNGMRSREEVAVDSYTRNSGD